MQKKRLLGVVLVLGIGVLLWSFILTFYTNKRLDDAASQVPAQQSVESKSEATPPVSSTAPETQTYQKPESTRTTHSS